MQTCRKLSVITSSLLFYFGLSASTTKSIAEAFVRDYSRSWYCSEPFLGAATSSLLRLSRGDSLLTPTWNQYPLYKVDALSVKVSIDGKWEVLEQTDIRFSALKSEYTFLQKKLSQLKAVLLANKDFQKIKKEDQTNFLEALNNSIIELSVQEEGKMFAWNVEIFKTKRSVRLFVPLADGSSEKAFNLLADGCTEAEITRLKNKKELKFLWTLKDTPAWSDMEVLFKELD
jgi:hypothetical protein